MGTPATDDIAEQSDEHPVRDASKLVLNHPIALYDPGWLKRLHARCMWDGGRLREESGFCSTGCEERYAEWENGVVHVLVGREPLQTFYEQGRELGA